MKEEQECKNCRYYLEHYVKSGSRYLPIGGHCVNCALAESRKRDKYRLQPNCGHWEPAELQKAERHNRIKDTLRRMEEHLAEIAAILQDDE